MMGSDYVGDWLDGGSAAHINLDAHLSKEQYAKLIKYAASVGCSYLTWNIPNCECDDCGFIAKQPFEVCPRCGSKLILRTAKKGTNVGNQFYGCSAFPKCRYIKNI